MTTQNYLATSLRSVDYFFEMEITLADAGTQVTNPPQSHVGKNERAVAVELQAIASRVAALSRVCIILTTHPSS